MATLFGVDPATFINELKGIPAVGRGAWTKTGFDFDDYRYRLGPIAAERIGARPHVSLSHWAVAAGSYAIQKRLIELQWMAPLADSERGIFGPRTAASVKLFQAASQDPDGGAQLAVDGIVGRSDARALFAPLVLAAEKAHSIPNRLLLGQSNHESALDVGAVGYYIFYPEYRGVDRGVIQNNSKYNPGVSWLDAFDPKFALDWSAQRMRSYFNSYRATYTRQAEAVLWDAAVCAHNNPSAASKWAATGLAPTDAAAQYVSYVKAARF